MIPRLSRYVLAPLAMFNVAVGCGEERPLLHFAEIESVGLPEGFAPHAVAVDSTGRVALVSATTPLLAIVDGAGVSLVELDSGGAPLGVRFSSPDGEELEVLDGARGLLTTYRAGAAQARRPFHGPVRLQAAAQAPGGWFVVGLWQDFIELYWVRDDEWRYLYGLPLDEYRPEEVRLSSSREFALLTQRRHPFDLIVLDTAGVVRFDRMDAQPDSADLSVRYRHAFPAVLARDYVLQMRADLNADTYDLLLSSTDGLRTRTRSLPRPMIFLAEVPGGSELLALRHLAGYPELVRYSWREAVR